MSSKVIRDATHLIRRERVQSLAQLETLKSDTRSQLASMKEAMEAKSIEVYEQSKLRAQRDVQAKWAAEFQQLVVLKEKILDESQQDIVRLAFGLCEKVMGVSLDSNPAHFLSYVQSMLDEMARAQWVHINVHPEHVAHLDKELRLTTHGSVLKVIGNDLLSKLDCIIETDIGGLDARFETQLDVLKAALLKEDNVPESSMASFDSKDIP